MFRLTMKGLFAHKLRFALTALAVMLGVSFLSGTMILNDTIKKTFDELFADVNRGTDAYVRAKDKLDTGFGDEQRARIPASLVDEIGTVPGVAKQSGTPVVEGQVQLYAQMVDSKGDTIGGGGPPTFGFNWSDFDSLNSWTLLPGSEPPTASDEVVVDKGSADKGDFEVGDTVKVLTQAEPAEYTISGIAKFGDADSPGGATVIQFTTARAQEIADAVGQFDGIAVAGVPGVSQTDLVDRITTKIGDPEIQVITGAKLTEENQNAIQQGLSFFNTALTIFALIALFVCCFIIFNTFSIIVAQRIREMALLRAIGASGRQVLLSVLGESLIVGLVASVFGLLFGILLSAGLKALLAGFGIDIPAGGTVINARTIIVGLVVGTLVTFLSALFPARKAARVPPVAAMRDVAIERTGASIVRVVVGLAVTVLGVASLLAGLFVVDDGISLVGIGAVVVFVGVALLGPAIARPVSSGLGWPLVRIKGTTGSLARENATRNPKRTSSTAAALMIGVALVGFITIFAASTKESISAAVDRAFRADYVVNTKGGSFGGGGFSPELAQQVQQLPEIQAASGLAFNAFEINGSSKFLAAADPSALLQVLDMKPEQPQAFRRLGPGQIAVSREVADDKHWEVGKSVDVKYPVGGTRPVEIGAIYGTGQKEGLSDYLISSDAYAEAYPAQLDNIVFAKLKPGVTPAEGRRAIDSVVKAYPSAEVQDQAQYKASQEAQIDQIVNLIYALLALAVIIAGIGIANTLALSIVERTRELGLLRAVGMTRAQLKSTIRWEAVIIAMLGTVLGLVIGLFFGWAMVEALKDQGITEFSPPGVQLVIIVLIAALLAVVFAYFPARRAAKLNVLRAISTE